MKTILQVYGGSPKKRGSLEEYFLLLASELHRRGYASIFVVNRDFDPALMRLYERHYAHVVIVPDSERRVDVAVIERMIRLFRVTRPSLVNFHFGSLTANGLLAARLSGISNTVWTKHSFFAEGPYFMQMPQWRKWLSSIQFQGRLARKIVAISDGLKREVLLYGLPEEKIERIYLGIDLTRFRSENGSTELALELGIRSGERVIACVGQARQEKGLEHLIRAAKIAAGRKEALRLLLVGGGPLTERLQALAYELGIASQVTFCGVRNDVEKILSLCDFTVVPSLTEGLSLAALESQAAGKPVVGSRVGGIPEVVTDGVTGLLIPPGDDRALADALCRLLDDRLLLRRMSEESLNNSRGFDVEKGVADTVSLYERLIRN